MRRAPQRHVLAEEPVPRVVQREPEQRDDAADEQQDSAERHAPGADADPCRVLVVAAEQQRDVTRERDPGEPDDDEVVGGIRKRPGVATVVDVTRHVPVEPEHRGQQRPRRDRHGKHRPPREPGDPLGERGEPVEDPGPAGQMQTCEDRERRDEAERDDRRGDQVLDRCPAALGRVRVRQQHG
jgi:hypothetical protein